MSQFMVISKHPEHLKIIKLLEDNFITFDNGGLNSVYQRLIHFSLTQNPTIEDKKNIGRASLNNLKYIDKIRELNVFDKITTLASDLPIFIKSESQNAKTIMVCAMDALPPTPSAPEDFNRDTIGFGSPFNLMEKSTDENYIFFQELSKDYNLYVTDIYKLFFYVATDKKNKKNQDIFSKSNTFPEFKIIETHRNILKEEIDIIKPHCIITLGNDSRNSIVEISNETNNKKVIPVPWIKKDEVTQEELAYLQVYDINSYKVISSPHISNSANGTKAALLRTYVDLLRTYEDYATEKQKNKLNTLKMAKIIKNKIEEF